MNRYHDGDFTSSWVISPLLSDSSSIPFDTLEEYEATTNNDMKISTGSAIAANTSDLTNDTGTEQKMMTPSFEYTSEDSVETQTTHTVGVGITSTATVDILFASGSLSLSANYDFSTSKSVSTTESRTWTVPSQEINVPANKHYKLTWVLKTGVASGTTNLNSRITGNIPYKKNPENGTRYGVNIGSAITEQREFEETVPTAAKWGESSNWTVDDVAGIRKMGDAKYTAKYGTEMTIKISDVTNPNNPKTVAVVPAKNVIRHVK